jgi:hypothetical protein
MCTAYGEMDAGMSHATTTTDSTREQVFAIFGPRPIWFWTCRPSYGPFWAKQGRQRVGLEKRKIATPNRPNYDLCNLSLSCSVFGPSTRDCLRPI